MKKRRIAKKETTKTIRSVVRKKEIMKRETKEMDNTNTTISKGQARSRTTATLRKRRGEGRKTAYRGGKTCTSLGPRSEGWDEKKLVTYLRSRTRSWYTVNCGRYSAAGYYCNRYGISVRQSFELSVVIADQKTIDRVPIITRIMRRILLLRLTPVVLSRWHILPERLGDVVRAKCGREIRIRVRRTGRILLLFFLALRDFEEFHRGLIPLARILLVLLIHLGCCRWRKLLESLLLWS